MFSAMLNRVIRITTKQMTDGLNREQKLIEWSNSDCVKQKMTSNRRPACCQMRQLNNQRFFNSCTGTHPNDPGNIIALRIQGAQKSGSS
ncbi:hypothetical protein RYB69_16505 [Pseudomonas syringae]|nr:hypothetical protein [Pseudomonas syringae]